MKEPKILVPVFKDGKLTKIGFLELINTNDIPRITRTKTTKSKIILEYIRRKLLTTKQANTINKYYGEEPQ